MRCLESRHRVDGSKHRSLQCPTCGTKKTSEEYFTEYDPKTEKKKTYYTERDDEIRALYRSGASRQELGERFFLSRQRIHQIVGGGNGS